ncbi:CYTH domain-containing protein [Anaerosalibacter bizertensis]|uniref:CYTH domain-containing protein n=1 Tax=Anaerosalibacter bizertensis TaxID=932217 RepID=A0A9Q4FLZ8_9FIRM|nr:CYTH domain-containing protein [Anaerosalibacter bizertensis]MBV1819835.1 CYTH domain-containing protein [Bacteroidales bacterium MSK.15.36]MCG4565120.1 CYTH domain-containing protein [Anaerosalibacter bizertensis]MCG4581900.1 CYTH domain-containing protein [Anaerosalibacter bizertensis]
MAKELEVKVLNIDKEGIEKQLIGIGASLISREEQINYLLDSKENKIQNEHDSYLRLREKKDLETGKVDYTFTLKENVARDGIRENIEINTKIENKNALLYILEVLGVHTISKGFKERISYKYNDIRFDIDTWDKDTYPYTYMEIEVEKEEDLNKAIKILNIDEKNISTKSIVELREDLGLND